MKDSKTKEQEAELQKLAKKPLPQEVKKSLQEKLKGIIKPFCK